MKLFINGDEMELEAATLSDVVDAFDLEKGLVVMEVDGTIIDREKWDEAKVCEGMTIELVHFVGGG